MSSCKEYHCCITHLLHTLSACFPALLRSQITNYKPTKITGENESRRSNKLLLKLVFCRLRTLKKEPRSKLLRPDPPELAEQLFRSRINIATNPLFRNPSAATCLLPVPIKAVRSLLLLLPTRRSRKNSWKRKHLCHT